MRERKRNNEGERGNKEGVIEEIMKEGRRNNEGVKEENNEGGKKK